MARKPSNPNRPNKRRGASSGPQRENASVGGRGPSNRRSGGKPASGSGDKLRLYGLHTVRAALENPQRRKSACYITPNAANRLGDLLATHKELPLFEATLSDLDRMVGSEAVHQGVVLECEPLDTLDESELFHLADAKLVLVLDQVTDPHNVGAILRTAVAMNVDAVLMTSRNTAAETSVLAKSASGALDQVRLVHLRNLSKAIDELNAMGFMTAGLDSEGPKTFEEELTGHRPKAIALVLGSEGRGLREKTRATCNALVRLDMPGAIKSLNVSNAAVLALYLASKAVQTSDQTVSTFS